MLTNTEIENYLQKLVIILDTGILGLVTNPKSENLALECKRWLTRIELEGIRTVSSEISDYEIRRELIRAKKTNGLRRLNELREEIGCLPINRETMQKAAELWAWARQTGQSTAHEESLDGDVILAAQAIILGLKGKSPIIATTNVKHIARYTPALHWRDISLENCIKKCFYL